LPPTLVIEVTSAGTRQEDLNKKALYERLGVTEYVLYDPLGEYLNPRIQVFRLSGGKYVPIPQESRGSLQSRTVGLTFTMEGPELRLIDTATGNPVLRDAEVRELARTAERELARLREELAKLRGQT